MFRVLKVMQDFVHQQKFPKGPKYPYWRYLPKP